MQASRLGEFDWSPRLQGALLSAFFYGFCSTQLLGGLLAERLGGRRVLGGGLLGMALAALATPVAARDGVPSPECQLLSIRIIRPTSLAAICIGYSFTYAYSGK